MHPDILFDTNRFNLSQVKAHFINPCCFGEDLAVWLRAKLIEKDIPTEEPAQEDWGWYIESRVGKSSYFIGIGGNSDEMLNDPDQGEWRIAIQKHRTLWEKITGRNQTSLDDSMFAVIEEILRGESDFQNIRRE